MSKRQGKAKNKTHKSRKFNTMKGGWGESYNDFLKLKEQTRQQGKQAAREEIH